MSTQHHVRNIAVVGWEGSEQQVIEQLIQSANLTNPYRDSISFSFHHRNEEFSINIVEVNRWSIQSIGGLSSDSCFNVVDGVILVLNYHTQFMSLCHNAENTTTVYSDFLTSVLKTVQDHNLKLIVFLNGFQYMKDNQAESKVLEKMQYFVNLLRNHSTHKIPSFQQLQIVIGNLKMASGITHDFPQTRVTRESLTNALFKKVIEMVPSPKVAQQSFPLESLADYNCTVPEVFEAIKQCDEHGMMVLLGIKQVPKRDHPEEFLLLCKVLSGKVKTGVKVSWLIKDPECDCKQVVIENVENFTGQDVTCGSMVLISGLARSTSHDVLLYDGPVSKSNYQRTRPSLNYCYEVRFEFETTAIPCIIFISRRMQSNVLRFLLDEGTIAISSTNYLALLECLKMLKTNFGREVSTDQIKIVVKETISSQTPQIMCKSNVYCRIILSAESITKYDEIESYPIGISHKIIENRDRLVIHQGNNMLIDCTTDTNPLSKVEHIVNSIMHHRTLFSILTDSEMTGIKFKLEYLHLGTSYLFYEKSWPSHLHRIAARAMYGCVLSGKPKLMQFVCCVHVVGSTDGISKFGDSIKHVKFQKAALLSKDNQTLENIFFKIPCSQFIDLFDMHQELIKTESLSIYSYPTDELVEVEGDPLVVGTPANLLVSSIRQSKQLNSTLPELSGYSDRY